MMNLSIYNANLDIINISSTLFRITQHIPSVQQQEMFEKLAALPPVPIKRITKELMGEVLQEILLSDIFVRFLYLNFFFLNHFKTHNEKTIDHAKFHTKP